MTTAIFILVCLTVIISIGYAFLLIKLAQYWEATSEFDSDPNHIPTTNVSVIIACRNEEKNIKNCILSILNNRYPKALFEIVVINDHSTDSTFQILNSIHSNNLRVIDLDENQGKKEALTQGIRMAKGDLIVCTDADSIAPVEWLQTIVNYYELSNIKAIAGLIKYQVNDSILQRFQYIDSLNNMCLTNAGISSNKFHLANGANLIFEKKVFEEVEGYKGNEKLASGDDVFLIQKIADKYPSRIGFLKSSKAIIETQPEETLRDLIAQRKRWATKSSAYKNRFLVQLQGFVFVFACLILLCIVFAVFGKGIALTGLILSLFIKWTIDYIYLKKLSNYFGDKQPIKSFLACSILYFPYILFAGFQALFPSKYEWKERRVE